MLISDSIAELISNSYENEATQNSRRNSLKRFQEFLRERMGHEPTTDEIYDNVLVDFKAWLFKRGVKGRSAQTYVAGVKAWLENALTRNLLPSSFSFDKAKILYKRTGKATYHHHPPEYFDKVGKLIAHLSVHPVMDEARPKGKYIYLAEMRNRAFALFLYATAARQTTARTLKLSQVLDEKGDIREAIHARGKRDKDLLLVVEMEDARVALKQYLDARKTIRPDNSPYVFISHDHNYGEPIERSTAFDIIKSAAKEIGLDYSPHDIRHAGAVYMLNNGVPLDVVSAWLGHSNLTVTNEVYAQHKQVELVKKIRSVPMPSVG